MTPASAMKMATAISVFLRSFDMAGLLSPHRDRDVEVHRRARVAVLRERATGATRVHPDAGSVELLEVVPEVRVVDHALAEGGRLTEVVPESVEVEGELATLVATALE